MKKSGIAVAAIISAGDLDELTRVERERKEDLKALDATRETFKDVSDEELEREVARAISEIRFRNRRARTFRKHLDLLEYGRRAESRFRLDQVLRSRL